MAGTRQERSAAVSFVTTASTFGGRAPSATGPPTTTTGERLRNRMEIIRLGLGTIWVSIRKGRCGRHLEGQELACNTGLILMIHFYYYM